MGRGYRSHCVHRRSASAPGVVALCASLVCGVLRAADQPEVFPQLGHSNVVHSVAFAPNGHVLASAGEDGATKLWDVGTRRELRTLKRSAEGVNAVAISPDGATVATGGRDGLVVLWGTATGSELRTLKGHAAAVNSVAFSPDGRSLASGSADHTVKLWNVASGNEARTLSAHRDAVTTVAFSADGATLASGSVDKTIKLWDAAAGRELRTLSGHTDRLTSLAFCRGTQTLASASWDHTVKLWDAASGHELRTLRGHSSEVWSVACAGDGHTLASGGYDHSIRLWDGASGRELHALPGDARWVEAVTFSPDGRTLASGGADHAVKLWDVTSGEKLATLEGHAAFVKSVAFAHNGKMLVSGSADRAVRLWRVADGYELRTIVADQSWVSATLFTPDNRTVASRGGDQQIKLWDIISGRELRSVRPGSAIGGSASVAISPDGRTLAAGGASNSLKLWNVADGAEVRAFVGHTAPVEAVAFSPDGQTLASGDEHGAVKLWNVASARELRSLAGHTSWVGSVAFSPDGQTLASGSGDKTVRLWEVSSGRELRTLSGHTAAVTSVAFAPKEAQLASSDESGAIRIWDAGSGRELRSLRGHTDLVESVAFSPDGRLLASASADSTLRLWDVASGTERLRLIAFTDGGILQITPQGYYDFQGDTAEQYVNVRRGNEVSGISTYREKFYRPDLVRLALNGGKLPDTLATLASVKPPPDVALVGVPPEVESEALDLHVSITDRGGGIGDVRTFVNNSAVSDQKARGLEVVEAAGVPARTVHVHLVPGKNDIRVVAFNADGSVHSNPAVATVTARYTSTAKPQLYALVVGIQDFDNNRLNLRFSVADATAIAELLQQKARPLFDKVNIEQLITHKDTTKTALLAAFNRYRTIAADDVFVFYVASHGTVESADLASREYFLIPSNVNAITDEAIRRDAVSEGDLKQAFGNIPALHKLLLLDTCHAGAGGDAVLLELASYKILSGASGSAVFSASTSDQEALEGQDGHGLFTWVLLQGLRGEADAHKHGYIDTGDLAYYVKDEVPRIAEQRFNRKQTPTFDNFGEVFEVVSSR
jgi:WD40 repeat protein